jgi:hypothetical protein
MIEHVIVKADEHTVLGRPNVDLVSVGSQLERGPVSFQRVLMRKLDSPTMADNVNVIPSLRDTTMTRRGLHRSFLSVLRQTNLSCRQDRNQQ